MSKIVLIDGHSILNRAFYGIPDLTNSEGLHTNAVYGFLNIMFKILDEEQPDHLAVIFDRSEPTFRHKMYSEYKGNRAPMAAELRQQVPLVKDVLHAMGIETVEKAGYEADDILGTISREAENEGFAVRIISGDRDLLQLATDDIMVRIPKTKRGGTEIEDYYAGDVLERYQVTPTEYIDVKALMGDSSDNIPGVPGIGEKGATAIISKYKSIENAYSHLDEITPARAKNALAGHYDLAQLSKALAAIDTNADIDYDMDSAVVGDFYTPEAYNWFKRLEFKNMLSRFDDSDTGQTPLEDCFVIVTDDAAEGGLFAGLKTERAEDDLLAGLKTERAAVYFLEEDGVLYGAAVAAEAAGTSAAEAAGTSAAETAGTSAAEAAGTSAAETAGTSAAETATEAETAGAADADGRKPSPDKGKSGLRVLYFPCENELVRPSLENRIQRVCDSCGTVIAPDLKALLKHVSVEEGRGLDTTLAAYLLNPLKNDYPCDDIAKDYLGKTIPGKADLLGKTKLAKAVSEKPDAVARLACYTAWTAYCAADPLTDELAENGMDELYREIELPLVYVLDSMEKEGVCVDGEALRDYGEQLSGRIAELEQSIYDKAGEEFNINSPKQLGVILFEKLGMPNGKKTKTGYSTAADVLEKLAPDYPIVSEILEYRTLTKLKSTYAEGLAACIAPDGRIHTTFNQTITATGRLSSTEPNLQNIPIRMELGSLIRKVFIPRDGFVFVDADYSQIELRVLASMSEDENLIAAYRHAEDIHRVTASQVFHTPPEEVTPLQRRNAKAVNFGIVYGISSFGLSQDLSISRGEAEEYIERYFETFPGVKRLLDRLVSDAKKNGCAVTMFGRRRPVPELFSSNFMQRSFGERVAMNSPIQGSAADIIKIAMNRVYRRLRDEGLSSKLVLQVHDELLVETARDEADRVINIVREEMSHAAKLSVDLAVEEHVGDNWLEAH